MEFAEQALILAALFGVVWSTFEFVRAQSAKRRLSRLAETSEWRKLAIHQTLMASEEFLSVEQITNGLRTQSFDNEINLEKDELSPLEVRKVLVEMVSEGILGQVFPNLYGIAQLQRDVTVPAVIENIRSQHAARKAFREIHKHPERFTSEELYSELEDETQLELPDFVLAILSLENHGAAVRNADGKWLPIPSKESA